MAHIETPKAVSAPIKSLNKFLEISGDWHEKNRAEHGGMLSELWYRGVNEGFPNQVPRVYRPGFTERANKLPFRGMNREAKRLWLECKMISQFQTVGAAFLEGFNETQIYFAAQHYGLPTRLLDWSTNPLAALFFACEDSDDAKKKDGFVYAMNATQVIAPDAEWNKATKQKLYQDVMGMRHPFVTYAIGLSFWGQLKGDLDTHVLPVRPDGGAGKNRSTKFLFYSSYARG